VSTGAPHTAHEESGSLRRWQLCRPQDMHFRPGDQPLGVRQRREVGVGISPINNTEFSQATRILQSYRRLDVYNGDNIKTSVATSSKNERSSNRNY
jgi:hypothetical protein